MARAAVATSTAFRSTHDRGAAPPQRRLLRRPKFPRQPEAAREPGARRQEVGEDVAVERLDQRKKIGQQIQIVATDDVVYIPWGVWKTPAATRASLKDMLKVPDSIVFWNVEKE